MNVEEYSGPWVSFYLLGELYAAPALSVQTMVELPSVTAVPQVPDFVRGVMNLRGQVIPVVDLRVRLGLPSRRGESADLVAQMHQREQEHRNWLAELEASVREEREFTGAVDPHQCAFGKWYDKFQTNDRGMSYLLGQFDEPHKRIHGLAEKVRALAGQGQKDQAIALIESTRDTDLARMLVLFEEFRGAIEAAVRELAVVLEVRDKFIAITVDSVDAVESIKPGTIEPLSESMTRNNGKMVPATARRLRDDAVALLMDVDALLDSMPGYLTEEAAAPAE